jgi:hypothetical protein
MTLEEYFAGRDESRAIFDGLRRKIEALGASNMRVTKSQVAFRRRRAFAWAWIPDVYLHGRHAPLVLTVSFSRRESSPRWKEIVQPAVGHFTHHLELHSLSSIDDEVRNWLHQAWDEAAQPEAE